MKNTTTAADKFHAHLDTCDQCARQPFNLCPTGDRLIKEAVKPPTIDPETPETIKQEITPMKTETMPQAHQSAKSETPKLKWFTQDYGNIKRHRLHYLERSAWMQTPYFVDKNPSYARLAPDFVYSVHGSGMSEHGSAATFGHFRTLKEAQTALIAKFTATQPDPQPTAHIDTTEAQQTNDIVPWRVGEVLDSRECSVENGHLLCYSCCRQSPHEDNELHDAPGVCHECGITIPFRTKDESESNTDRAGSEIPTANTEPIVPELRAEIPRMVYQGLEKYDTAKFLSLPMDDLRHLEFNKWMQVSSLVEKFKEEAYFHYKETGCYHLAFMNLPHNPLMGDIYTAYRDHETEKFRVLRAAVLALIHDGEPTPEPTNTTPSDSAPPAQPTLFDAREVPTVPADAEKFALNTAPSGSASTECECCDESIPVCAFCGYDRTSAQPLHSPEVKSVYNEVKNPKETKMIYAAKTKATDNALTVGGIDGKLQNDVYAFETKAEYQAKLDALFARGDNLIRLSRKEIERHYGRRFEILPNGLVGSEGISEHYTDEELDAMTKAGD